MKNNVSVTEDRQLITKEFADTIAGKTPSPYLRLHDPVQKALMEFAASDEVRRAGVSAYCDRMIHFWREVSLAGMPRAGKAMDECYALIFESAFDLAQAEHNWGLECLADKSASELPIEPLTHLARHAGCGNISHLQLTSAFTQLYAPRREADQKWQNEVCVVFARELWFWAAVVSAASIDENHQLWAFRCALARSSNNGWRDEGRLHARLIREAPQRALRTARAELMAHPILRIARLKYRDGSVEQTEVLRFLNAQCIKERFESEEDYFLSDLPLAQWARDARQWASNMSEAEPQVCEDLFHEAGKKALDRTRTFYHQYLGSDPANVDSLDATAAP
jgi:hypothetical protein